MLARRRMGQGDTRKLLLLLLTLLLFLLLLPLLLLLLLPDILARIPPETGTDTTLVLPVNWTTLKFVQIMLLLIPPPPPQGKNLTVQA